MQRRTSAPCGCRAAVASAPAKSSRQSRNQSFDGQTLFKKCGFYVDGLMFKFDGKSYVQGVRTFSAQL
jgi:hypothetical protein